ncbi:MAG: CHAT domain-containing protein [bacterium]|nr:CHAT domain-containing protein [bacterium]
MIIREKLAPNSLDSTSSFLNLGLVAWKRGDLTMAEAYYLRGLGILEKLAPDSLDVARCFNNLGLVAQSRGDFAKAEIYYRRDLAITEKLAPKSLYLAMSLVNLGVLAGVRGRFEEEESYYQRALVIFEKLAPKSAALAKCLTNLGVVAQVRGDLVVAEAYHLRAIALLKKQAPDSLDLANSFNNLGVIARARGDLATAERYHNRALAIRKQFTPESLVIATSLINLGTIAHVRDDPAAAETYYKRALSIQEKLAPDSLEPAHSFNNLGSIAEARGDLAVAETYYRRALRIQEKLAPNSLDAARSLNNLGSIAQTRGDLISALRYHRRALSLREKLAPNTTLQARTLHDIGTLVRKSYGARRAAYFLRRAVRALEGQMRRLGGSSGIRGSFRSQQELIYRDAVNVLLELERPDEAFHTLELYRARAFLELLAERDLLFSKDIPEELDRKRRWFAIRNDQLLQQMVEHPEGGEKLAESMRKLMQERNEIITEIRRKYPKLATLQYPQPLGLTEIQKHIDPGTAILSYNVGKEQTNLFVVTKKGGIEVYTLSLGQEELRRNVAGFLVEIERGRDSRTEFFTSMRSKGQRLYERLIQPVVDTLEASDRLLILPDGPLHYLPFDALIRPTGKNDSDSERHWQYLAEWKPLHVALSATVYAEIKKLRRLSTNSGSPLVAAFGDPSSSANSVQADGPRGVANVHVRAAVDSGLFNWDSLPYTREEVLQIADLHKNVQVYLGEGATEEKVKSIDRGVRILHFATHGHLDDYFPLNSALVLALPEGFPENRDNGLLQAWEIFESVRIDADLVVLSACQSALGKEQGGEGLIGLTRAFQYAGARSVVATLWSVADRATAELMVRFYQHLNAGEAKDHALQAAQIELIRGPIEVTNEDSEIEIRDYSAPYYWAGFQLYGDWQ